LLFAQARLDGDPPILGFTPSLGDRQVPPCPAFFHQDGVS
jgi:hypothetical protein